MRFCSRWFFFDARAICEGVSWCLARERGKVGGFGEGIVYIALVGFSVGFMMCQSREWSDPLCGFDWFALIAAR